MGIGREVADAYIDVHGDLSSFRRDLQGADDAMREAAFESADSFSDAWAKRVESDVHGKWGSIVDAMYSEKQIDWDRMFGEFNPRSLEEARDKVAEFLDVMREARSFGEDDEGNEIDLGPKFDDEQFRKMLARMDEVVEGMQKQEDHQRRLIDLQQELTQAQDLYNRVAKVRAEAEEEAHRDNEAWMARRAKTMADAQREAERLARTFEGMFKDNKAAALTDDFKAMSRAMSDMDWSKFAKGFDSLADASRRVREINALMHEQGRISEENAAAMQRSIDDFILSEKEKSKAMKDALDETNRLRKAQDAYNQSLSGMARNFHFAELEGQFRRLAAAMDSNDWTHFAKNADSAKEMQFRISEVAAEMHRLGRMSDEELKLVYRRAKEASGSFAELSGEVDRVNKAMERTSSSGGGGGKFRKLLSGLGDATRGLREHLGGFAGLNVFGDLIHKGLDFIHNLDRIAVSVGKNTILLGSMAAVGASAFAGLITVASDLAGVLGGLAVALPAFAVGAGIGVGVLIAAMKDMKTVLADLKPAFAELQNQISASFWKESAGPIREMVKTLMPILTPKLKGTATALGGLVGKLATAFKDIPADSLNTMFDRMNKSIDILGNAMAPIVRAFTTLGLVGSKYFERFSTWIVKLADQFDAFIQKSAENGDLDKWINNMIEGFKDIGRAIDGAMGIFNALNRAAERAGFGGLKTFADAMQRAADIMNTPAFQNTLTIYLDGARDLALKLGKAIYDLGPAFESFAPTANLALNSIGDAVKLLIGYVGDIFTNPVFQQGVEDFTTNLALAVEKLQPAIKPFGDSLGQALSLLGQIVVSVAEVATAMVVNWTPVLDSMSTKLETLITPLKNGVIKAIEDLTPILEGIDKNIVGPLVTALTGEGGLIAVLTGPGGLTEKIGVVGTAFTEDLGGAIKPLVGEGGVLTGMVKVVGELLGPLGALFSLFTPTLQGLLEGVGTALHNLANDIKVLKGELPFTDLHFFKSPSDEEIKAKLEEELRIQSWGEILSELLIGSIPNAIAQAFQKMWDAPAPDWMSGLWEAFLASWNKYFEDGKGGALSQMQRDFAAWVKTVDWGAIAKDLWDGFLLAMWSESDRRGWDEIVKGFTGWVEDIKKFFGIQSPSTLMFDMASDIVNGFLNGFGEFAGKVAEKWEEIKTTVGTKFEELKAGLAEKWEGFKAGWGEFWGGVGTTLGTKWEEFKSTVGTKAGEIKTGVDTWATNFGNGWNGFWTDTGKNLGTAWDGFVGTTKDKAGEIKTNVDNFGTDVKKNWDGFWGGVGTTLTNKWGEFTGTTDKKSGEMQGDINDMTGNVKSDWQAMLSQMSSQINSNFQAFVNVVMNKAGEIVSWVSGMPGRIMGAIGNLGSLLWSAGWNIMTGFLNGLISMWGRVQSFVGGIANWIAQNKGPLAYDRALLEPAGEAIMQGLDKGIRSGMDPLLNTLQAITAAVSDTVTADLSKSVMYATGKDAAQGLADGLKANRTSVHTALGNLGAFTVPSSNITVGGSLGSVGRPTTDAAPGRSVTIAEGAIKIETPTKSPELVAAKVIDSFVNYSTF